MSTATASTQYVSPATSASPIPPSAIWGDALDAQDDRKPCIVCRSACDDRRGSAREGSVPQRRTATPIAPAQMNSSTAVLPRIVPTDTHARSGFCVFFEVSLEERAVLLRDRAAGIRV